MWAPLPARGDASPGPGLPQRLHDAYYQEGVLEYCGLVTPDVYDGYERLVRYLIAAGDFDRETDRRIRIAGSTDADYQFGNHGLAGQRLWCSTDGREYVEKFLDFRRRSLSGEVE